MKTLLSILIIASVSLNVFLLVGCVSAHATRLYPQEGLGSNAEIIRNGLPQNKEGDALKEAFGREHDHYTAVQGKIVIVLDNTEEIRNAKRILVIFDDAEN